MAVVRRARPRAGEMEPRRPVRGGGGAPGDHAGGPGRARHARSEHLPGDQRPAPGSPHGGVALHAVRHVYHDPGPGRDRAPVPPVPPGPRPSRSRGSACTWWPSWSRASWIGGRPAALLTAVEERELFGADSLGYPSGHAAVAAALTVVVAAHLSVRWLIAALALGAVVLFGRMYVGAHLPLDIIGGAALGAIGGQRRQPRGASPAASRVAVIYAVRE